MGALRRRCSRPDARDLAKRRPEPVAAFGPVGHRTAGEKSREQPGWTGWEWRRQRVNLGEFVPIAHPPPPSRKVSECNLKSQTLKSPRRNGQNRSASVSTFALS